MSKLLLTSIAFSMFAGCTSADDSDITDQLLAADPVMPDYSGKADGGTIQEIVALYCPGVDYDAGVPTYKGLAGTYQRVTLQEPGEPFSLSLFPIVDDPGATGSFTGTKTNSLGFQQPFFGTFYAGPDNPAIGAAFGLDENSDKQLDSVYFVLGLSRSFGRVSEICLAGKKTPVLMTRVF
jgi:hypothetical protein